MRAKICGITTLADARFAIEKGAWALGFNFFPKSPRYIEPSIAKNIIRQLPTDTLKVGIVIDIAAAEISALISAVGLDLIQIYTEVDVRQDLKKRIIFSVQANHQDDIPEPEVLRQYGYLLLDSPKGEDGLSGGTGRLSNWLLAHQLAKHYRLILAGGLNPQNVREAISRVQPYAVDVASGVQLIPGTIEPSLLTNFLRQMNDE